MLHTLGVSNTVSYLLSRTINEVLRYGFFASFDIYQPFNLIGHVIGMCIGCYREEEEKVEEEGLGYFRPGARSMPSSLSVVLFDRIPCRFPMQSTNLLLQFVSAGT